MDVDDESDIYSPEPTGSPQAEPANAPEEKADVTTTATHESEEDESEEDSDSDIDIITERKDGSKPVPPPTSRYNNIRDIPQRAATGDATAAVKTSPAPAVKKEATPKETSTKPSSELPAVATSKIDVNARPVYEPAGKRITELNIDDDLGENEKPWRRPGTDITDYFNYGFDEFTWALYAGKQENIRAEYDPEKIAESNKKMMEDMSMMMAMSGMPPAGGGMPMPGMTGAEGVPPDMQAMLQQMMASGMDPSQMDPSMFAAMQGGQGGAAGQATGQGGNQGQGFPNQQGYGQGQNNFGFDQGMNSNRNNFRGRGRGRNW